MCSYRDAGTMTRGHNWQDRYGLALVPASGGLDSWMMMVDKALVSDLGHFRPGAYLVHVGTFGHGDRGRFQLAAR